MKTLISIIALAVAGLQPLAGAEEKTASAQKKFENPLEAADALIAAAETGENAPLIEIFGSEQKDLIGTVDAARDKELRAKVARMAKERRRFRFNDNGSVTMVIGFEAWPFPIPMVKGESGWCFDTAAGAQEVVKRRIGENELTAIAAMRAYVDAQRRYASEPRDGSKVRQFARKFLSAKGKKDGLYWPADAEKGEAPGPGDPDMKDSDTPFAGYRFKILTAQGAAAPAGKYSYIINDRLIAGFAMVAWPADYGKTGVMSFLVNHYGDVWEKDLGPETGKIAASIAEYDPDNGWNKVAE